MMTTWPRHALLQSLGTLRQYLENGTAADGQAALRDRRHASTWNNEQVVTAGEPGSGWQPLATAASRSTEGRAGAGWWGLQGA